jgi:hypothetical protein
MQILRWDRGPRGRLSKSCRHNYSAASDYRKVEPAPRWDDGPADTGKRVAVPQQQMLRPLIEPVRIEIARALLDDEDRLAKGQQLIS